MKNFNLFCVEALSTREMSCVKGGGEESIPTPIIIVEDGPATERAVAVLTINFMPATTTPARTPRRKRR